MPVSNSKKAQKKSNSKAFQRDSALEDTWQKWVERAGDWRTAAILSGAYTVTLLIAAHFYHRVGDYGVETDFFWNYAPDAQTIQNIVLGKGGIFPIDGFRGPMYTIALAVVALMLPDFFSSGVIFGIFCAGAVLFLTHRLIHDFFGKKEALFVLLILATNSVFIQYSYSAGTDMFFNFVATLSIYASLKTLNNNGWQWLIIASLATGLALLTRQNAFFLIAGFLVSSFALNPSQKSLKERWIEAGIFLGIIFGMYTPYGWYTLHEKGKFFYSTNYLNVAKDLFGRETNWDTFWYAKSNTFQSLGDVILSDPLKFFTNTLANVPAHFWGDMGELTTWFLGVFVIGGVIVSLIQRQLTCLQLSYFIFSVFHFGVLLIVFYGARFSLNILAVYALLAILFFQWNLLPRMTFALLPLAIFAVLISSIQFHRKNIDSGPQEMLLLREKFFEIMNRSSKEKSDELIITRKPHIAYYLNLKMGGFPMVETYEELIAEARKLGASYVYYSYFESNLRPQFRSLFNTSEPHEGLEPIMTLQNPPAVLYRVKPQENK